MEELKEKVEQVDLTPALRIWAKRKNIRPVDLQRALGWSYSHAWGVLRGSYKFSQEAYGHFFMVYGLPELEEILRIAKIDLKGIVKNAPSK